MNEARNTFNSIVDRPLVVTRFWCKFGFHRWQKWSDIHETNKIGYTHITEIVQDRYCDSCNAYQRKKISNKF